MQGVFYWGMKISRKEADLLLNELSVIDYAYLRENCMFEILGHDGYIFGEIIESIYPEEEPVEGPLDIFKADRADQSRIMFAYNTIAKPVLKRDFYGRYGLTMQERI